MHNSDNRNRFRNQSHFCWNRNRNQQNQIGLESEPESRIEALESESGISIPHEMLDMQNIRYAIYISGIGIKRILAGIGIGVESESEI